VVKLDDLMSEEREAVAKITRRDGTTAEIDIRYKPNVFTGDFIDRLYNSSVISRPLADQLAETLTYVGITDEEGEPIPVTGEMIHKVIPFDILLAIMNAIQEANQPEPVAASKPNNAGSFGSSEDEE